MSHWKAKENLAGLCVCRIESDGYQPTGQSGPHQMKATGRKVKPATAGNTAVR